MQAGVCAGATGTGDCVGSGWSPHYLTPLAWANQIEALAAGQTVCPFCLVRRADLARVPGWNKPKRDRVAAVLSGFHCMAPGGSRSLGHTHLFDFEAESLTGCRDVPPQPGERGY